MTHKEILGLVTSNKLKGYVYVHAHVIEPYRGAFEYITPTHVVLKIVDQENVITYTHIPFELIKRIEKGQ